MRTIIVQPTFQLIQQPYEECLKELPPPLEGLYAGNLELGEERDIVLDDERSTLNTFNGRRMVAAIERAGSGNTYAGGTRLVTHCDRKEVVGVSECFLCDDDIKKYVFLFDHIVWPTTTCGTNIGIPTQLVEFLESKDFLSRNQFNVTEEIYLGNKFFRLFLLAFESYEKLKQGTCSIAQDRSEFYLPSSFYANNADLRTAELRLHNALPIPGENVPMQDIWEFKVENYDILNRLWRHIDGIYLKLIEDGPDVIRRNNMLIAEFEEEVREVLSEMKKSGLRRALSSMSVQYKLPVTLAGLGVGIGDVIADMPLELGAVVGSLAGYAGSHFTIEIARGAGFLGKEGRLEPLAYLSLGARSFQLDFPPSMAGGSHQAYGE